MNRKYNTTTQMNSNGNVAQVAFGSDNHNTTLNNIVEQRSNGAENNKVLLIDESNLCRHMISSMLSTHGCLVVEAKSTYQGMSAICNEKPDLIILDATMPGSNAFETLNAIQTSEFSINTPVIILTSEDLLTDHQANGLYAADDFLFKPVTSTSLMEKVDQYIDRLHVLKH